MKNAYETSSLSDSKLIIELKYFIHEERKLTTKILHYLQEVEIRKLYLKAGYSSLFDYAVKELGYSSDAAYRRISAMRLLKILPKQELESKIESGELSLTTVAKASEFFRSENKIRKVSAKPQISITEQKEILKELSFKSKREVEKILEQKSVCKTEQKVELKISLTKAQYEKLQKLKALLSNKNTNGSTEGLLEILMNEALKKHDPELTRKCPTELNTSKKNNAISSNTKPADKVSSKVQSQKDTSCRLGPGKVENNPVKTSIILHKETLACRLSRYIPVAIKKAVYLRDKGQCTYKNPTTNKKCDSAYYLEYDHIIPFALTGVNETATGTFYNNPHTLENLRLLCGAHHRLESSLLFGESPAGPLKRH